MACPDYFASAVAARFTQSAQILRPSQTRDRFNNIVDAPMVAHTYPCRVIFDTKPNSPALVADKSVVRSDWRILFALDVDILPDDRITVDNQTYEVLDSDGGRAGASFLTLFCRKTT